jgi:photosystem II stability/assembly factor-like uncharacterized protein
MSENNLEILYAEARQALKGKDYKRAADLLKQILVLDENYKDASRLLAQLVKEKRRRWYNDLRIWGPIYGLVIVGLLVWISPKLPLQRLFAPPAVTVSPKGTTFPTKWVTPTNITSPTSTPNTAPTPAPIPLAWKRISTGQEFPRDTVTAIVVNPNDPDILYAGMQNAGIYKSIDGGNSWQPAYLGLTNAAIVSLVIDFQNTEILYAGIQSGGVYKTNDGGATWQAANEGITRAEIDKSRTNIVVISPQSPETLYLFQGYGGYYQSANRGQSWKYIVNSCPASITSLIVSPVNPEVLFAASEASAGCQTGIYQSMDGGETWKMVFQIPADGWAPLGNNLSISQDGRYLLFKMGYEGAYISVDEGINWKKFNKFTLDTSTCTIRPENGSIIICVDGGTGFIKSQDAGISWHALVGYTETNSLGSKYITAFKPGAQEIMLIGGNGIYESTDGGSSWNNLSNGLGGIHLALRINPNNSKNLYIGVMEWIYNWDISEFYSSPDNGKSWKLITNPDRAGSAHGLAFDADGRTIYQLHIEELLRSDDNGTLKSSSLPRTPMSVFAHPSIAKSLYVTFEDNSGLDYILFTKNGGYTWEKINAPSSPGFNSLVMGSDKEIYLLDNKIPIFHSSNAGQDWVSCITRQDNGSGTLTIDPHDAKHLYLGTRGGGISISQDGCKSWQSSNTGLGSLLVNSVAIDPNEPDTVYAGTDGGAYISTDGGNTWNQINDGLLGATVVYSIVVDKDGNVYTATPYGVFILESK